MSQMKNTIKKLVTIFGLKNTWIPNKIDNKENIKLVVKTNAKANTSQYISKCNPNNIRKAIMDRRRLPLF